jgi:hypothetical protein
VVVVSGSGNSGTSGEDLASTDAELIGQDYRIVDAVARATSLSPAVVAGNVAATRQGNTLLIDVSFSAEDARLSAAGDAAIVSALTGPHRSVSDIPGGQLLLVSGPGTPSESKAKVPGGPVPVGIVLGLILGIAILIAWDRHDARVDDPELFEDQFHVPTTALDGNAVGALSAITQRWRDLCERSTPIDVALVSATGAARQATDATLSLLRTEGGDGALTYRAAAVPGTDGSDVTAMSADLVVLVVESGARVREIRSTIDTLRKLGVAPGWAIIAGDRP